jgi:hypothetical protein
MLQVSFQRCAIQGVHKSAKISYLCRVLRGLPTGPREGRELRRVPGRGGGVHDGGASVRGGRVEEIDETAREPLLKGSPPPDLTLDALYVLKVKGAVEEGEDDVKVEREVVSKEESRQKKGDGLLSSPLGPPRTTRPLRAPSAAAPRRRTGCFRAWCARSSRTATRAGRTTRPL